MSIILPYVNSTAALKRLLQKIREAQTPEYFNYDFMNTKLGISERAMISLLRKMGFIADDGKPTQLYRDFRNPDSTGTAVATGLRRAFEEIYRRNEYAHDLTREKLVKLLVEITGKDHDSKAIQSTYGTFESLRSEANFDKPTEQVAQEEMPPSANKLDLPSTPPAPPSHNKGIGLNLGYTVNLNLPETTNIDVYNAIFKSLNEHFLKHDQ